MRQALKIVGQICKGHFFPILCFATLHRMLFYGGWKLLYPLPLGEEGALWGQLFQPDLPVFLGLLLLGSWVSFFVLWEIAAYLLLYQRCYGGGAVSLFSMIWEGMGQAVRVCRLKNLWLLPLLLLVFPFQAVIIWSGLYLPIEIPHFVLQFLEQSPVLLACMNVLLLWVQIIGIKSLFLFHFLFLKGKSALDAWRSSSRMGLWRLGGTYALLCLWNIIWSLGSFLIYLGTVAAAFLLPSADAALLGIEVVEKVILFLQQCLFVPIGIAIVHSCYLVFFQGEESLPCPSWLSRQKRRLLPVIWGLALVLCCGYPIYTQGRSVGGDGAAAVPVIAAHRGYGDAAPENTVAAILAARDIGVDCIEIDVQMTRDGQIVLFHDGNLYRLLGVAKAVGEMDYADIRALVEERFGSQSEDSRPLPLLEEALAAGGADMDWNIEIKTYSSQTVWDYLRQGASAPLCLLDRKKQGVYGQERIRKEQLAAGVLSLLAEKERFTHAVVSSLDYEMLQLVKEKNPAVKTLYILPFAGSSVGNLPAADGYSIEITALQPHVYGKIKKSGKSLWVWTVNDIAAAAKLTSYQVDGVITDRPLLLKKVLREDGEESYRKHFLPIFIFLVLCKMSLPYI